MRGLACGRLGLMGEPLEMVQERGIATGAESPVHREIELGPLGRARVQLGGHGGPFAILLAMNIAPLPAGWEVCPGGSAAGCAMVGFQPKPRNLA